MVEQTTATITREQIEEFKRQRAQQCGQRLAELLREYDCDLVATPTYTQDGRTVCTIQLVHK